MTSTRTGHAQDRRFVLSTSRHIWISTALALFLLMIALAACQPAGQQLDLVGVWTNDFGYIQFDTDGIWGMGGTFGGLNAKPLAFGPYHLEGTLLTLETDEESNFCPGETGIYEVELSEQGELSFTLVDDPCGNLTFELTRGSYARFSP